MGFKQAILLFFKNYVVFNGRASRSEFWYPVVFGMGAGFLIGFAGTLAGASEATIESVGVIFQLLLIIPTVAVGVRRLHDIDKSGWFHLIALIPLLGMLILFYFFAQRGTSGDNRFGSDPLAQIEHQ
jgi:uncharacterized membrane protein YhaH (DUF805 family)